MVSVIRKQPAKDWSSSEALIGSEASKPRANMTLLEGLKTTAHRRARVTSEIILIAFAVAIMMLSTAALVFGKSALLWHIWLGMLAIVYALTMASGAMFVLSSLFAIPAYSLIVAYVVWQVREREGGLHP